jgi:hypothetical protein
VCEVDGRSRVTLRQEWTDRGAPVGEQQLSVDGLTALRAVIDAVLGRCSDTTQVGE